MIVLLSSVFNLLPVGFAMGSLIGHPLTRLIATLLVSFALTYGLVKMLRRRFLGLAVGEPWILRTTLRPLGRHSAMAAQELSTAGFSVVDTVVVATAAGRTLTRPIAVMRRHMDGRVVAVSSMGSTAMTLLTDQTWLVTSTTMVIAHPSIRVIRAAKRDALDVVRQHDRELQRLQANELDASVQPDPLEAVLHIEHLEQAAVASFRASGVASPSARVLAEVHHITP
jgi:hypothetical protein